MRVQKRKSGRRQQECLKIETNYVIDAVQNPLCDLSADCLSHCRYRCLVHLKYHLSQFTENHSLKLILSVTPIPHHSSQTPSTSSRPPSNIRSHSENPKAAHIPQPDVDALNQYLTPLLGQNPDPNHAAASKFDQSSLKSCDSYLGTDNDKIFQFCNYSPHNLTSRNTTPTHRRTFRTHR